jgi:hypothetical protein
MQFYAYLAVFILAFLLVAWAFMRGVRSYFKNIKWPPWML